MKIETKQLRTMLAHVSRCKPTAHLEITNYCEIVARDGKLTITARDNNNQLSTSAEIEDTGELLMIVKTDQLTKLINKTTTPEVELIEKDNYLLVKGNGRYKVESVNNETYPKIDITGDSYTIKGSDLINSIVACKRAKGTSPADGVLYGYCIDNGTMYTADAIRISASEIITNIEPRLLVPPSLAELLGALDQGTLDVIIDNNRIKFKGHSVEICGALMDNVEEYPNISQLLEYDYPYYCEIDPAEIKAVLDRLGIFIGPYDNNTVNLKISPDKLIMTTDKGIEETLDISVGNIDDITDIRLNIKYFSELIAGITEPIVKLHYGDGETIKLETTTLNMILSVSE